MGPTRGVSSRLCQPLSLLEPEASVTSLTEAPHLQATLFHHITTHLGQSVLLPWLKSIKEL